ncbi:ankyrin repeat [Fusarium albosuccineum]|uniref:Ankyrin repeat n=1 Tax=Fusarium albosuccineum TaxID=1237068 RepID=A0A8H4P8L3_9HYPO|nr:ankyrin repeat [Fusarium albosuccineum]
MSRSERIPAAQWDTHKERIRSLYIDQDKTLDEVMEDMFQSYGFRASMRGHYQTVAIIEVVQGQDIALVEQLLQAGADPNTLVPSGLFALRIAIGNQDLEMVKTLLDGGADPDFLCGNKQLDAVKNARKHLLVSGLDEAMCLSVPIRTAVGRGNTTIVESLLVAGASIDGYIDPDSLGDLVCGLWGLEDASRTALQTAMIERDVPMVELLLMRGASANAGHHTVPSPLQLACQLNEPAPQKTDLVTLLLKWGADVNAPAAHQEGMTALQAAIETGRMDLARLLLHSGATISAELSNEDGLAWLPTAEPGHLEMIPHLQCRQKEMALGLQAAVQSGSTLDVRQLLDDGADINKESSGISLLCESIRQNDHRMFDFLLSNGIDPDPPGADQTLLCAAISRRSRYMMQSLLRAGADVNRQSIRKPPESLFSFPEEVFWPDRCYTPIIAAVKAERADLVQMLVEAGANVNPPNSHSTLSPLLLAIHDEIWQVAYLLLHHGADPNATDPEDGAAAIHKVLLTFSSCKIEMCKVLIEFGANASAASSIGSPIQLACAQYNAQAETHALIQAFVDAGADVNAPPTEEFPMTALQKSIETSRDGTVVEKLLSLGADIHAPAFWDDGITALQAAAKRGNIDLINKLISLGADVNALPAVRYGATALQFAAMNGNIKIAMLLLEKGAHINAPGSKVRGRTALEGAAENGRLDMVYLLLENDDEVDLIEERCQEAAEYAEDEGHHVLAKLLREWKP